MVYSFDVLSSYLQYKNTRLFSFAYYAEYKIHFYFSSNYFSSSYLSKEVLIQIW